MRVKYEVITKTNEEETRVTFLTTFIENIILGKSPYYEFSTGCREIFVGNLSEPVYTAGLFRQKIKKQTIIVSELVELTPNKKKNIIKFIKNILLSRYFGKGFLARSSKFQVKFDKNNTFYFSFFRGISVILLSVILAVIRDYNELFEEEIESFDDFARRLLVYCAKNVRDPYNRPVGFSHLNTLFYLIYLHCIKVGYSNIYSSKSELDSNGAVNYLRYNRFSFPKRFFNEFVKYVNSLELSSRDKRTLTINSLISGTIE